MSNSTYYSAARWAALTRALRLPLLARPGRVRLLALLLGTLGALLPALALANTGDITSLPAITAGGYTPRVLVVGADNTIYFDNGDDTIRRLSPDGSVSLLVGIPGSPGYNGDGQPGPVTQLADVEGLALSPDGGVLYFADSQNDRIRQVNLATGLVSTFAGIGPYLDLNAFGGDGSPATAAWVLLPNGLATDAAGNVYFVDDSPCSIRKVDTSGIITTVAGQPADSPINYLIGDCENRGDGGPASQARLAAPFQVAVDAQGDLFVDDSAGNFPVVRRIAAGTGIITTIAGGSAETVTSAAVPATSVRLHSNPFLAADDAGALFLTDVPNGGQPNPGGVIYRLDLASDTIRLFAGTGLVDPLGDGGPAAQAGFESITSLAVTPNGNLLVDDYFHFRIRSIEGVVARDVIISARTAQAFLDSLNSVSGSLIIANVGGRDVLVLPALQHVAGDVTIRDNPQLVVIDLTALQQVGGNLTITGNSAMTSVDLSQLQTVGGGLTISGSPVLSAVLVSGVTSIGGDLNLLGSVATLIDLPSLTSAGGNLDLSGDTSATAINLGNLGAVGGNLDLNGDTALTAVNLGSLGSVGSNLSLPGGGGNLTLTGDTSVDTVNLGNLQTVGGNLDIADNSPSTSVNLGSLSSVGGDLTLQSTDTGVFNLGGASTGGNLDLQVNGASGVVDQTAGGSTAVANTTPQASVHLQLPAATFTAPVPFALTRLDTAGQPAQPGLDPDGAAISVAPVAAYAFTFAVPTLGRDATLSFDVYPAALDPATRQTFLAAVDAGMATLVTQREGVTSGYQSFAVCTASQTPSANGCVLVERLDATGQPTSGAPADVRFTGVVGHFSTWGVAVVQASGPQGGGPGGGVVGPGSTPELGSLALLGSGLLSLGGYGALRRHVRH